MKKIVPVIVSCLFILLFIYAALSKLLDYQKFRVQVGQSPLLTPFRDFVVWAIPAVEIGVAGLLAFPRTRLKGLYASYALMALFSAYIFAITRFSDYIPCSCGGILQKMNWNQHLVFNLAFVALGLLAIFFYHEGASAPDPIPFT